MRWKSIWRPWPKRSKLFGQNARTASLGTGCSEKTLPDNKITYTKMILAIEILMAYWWYDHCPYCLLYMYMGNLWESKFPLTSFYIPNYFGTSHIVFKVFKNNCLSSRYTFWNIWWNCHFSVAPRSRLTGSPTSSSSCLSSAAGTSICALKWSPEQLLAHSVPSRLVGLSEEYNKNVRFIKISY